MNVDTIINGEASKVMQGFPDACIDLTVTSPPYDNLRTYNGYEFDFEAIANELYRVTKDGGVVVWVVGDATIKGSETGTSFRQALYFKDIGFNLYDTMIYKKSGENNPNTIRYYQVFEYMFVLSKGKPIVVNLLRDRENKTSGLYRKRPRSNGKKKEYRTSKYGIRYNIWKYARGFNSSTQDRIAYQHPAIFPDQLAQDHIYSWSNEDDLVLDPMCGSGTTLKAAVKLKRRYIGIDISEEYCEIARQRIAEELAQPELDIAAGG